MTGVWLRCAVGHRWLSGLYHGRILERDRCPFCDGEPVEEGAEVAT